MQNLNQSQVSILSFSSDGSTITAAANNNFDSYYDDEYDTLVSETYGNRRIGYVFGPIFIFMGVVSASITIADLHHSIYNANTHQINEQYIYTWDENPFGWSYGKGFWVGLIFIATGIVASVSSCERTLTSIYAFIALSATSTIFSFYLFITTIIPVQSLAGLTLEDFENNTLGLNALLLALGCVGSVVGTVGCIVAGVSVGCCKSQRNNEQVFSINQQLGLTQFPPYI